MARKSADIVKDGEATRFTSTNQPDNPGRPKKLVSGLCAELRKEGYEEVTAPQVAEMISLMLNLEKGRIKELATDDQGPLYIQRTARRLMAASDKEVCEFIDKQIDRAHGKARQSTDMNVSGSLNVVWHEELTHADEVNEKADDSD